MDQSIEYNPSFIGKLARFLIPLLQKFLPNSLYIHVYNILYNSYKLLLRLNYALQLLMTKLFDNREQQLKKKLTFKLLPYTMGGPKALENAFEVAALIEQRQLDGAIVECGVAEGGTAAMMALTSKELGNIVRPKWFFDSYEGLPEPTVEDYEGGKAGNFIRPLPKGSCLGTIEQVSTLMFEEIKLSREEVNLIKGWFQDTVPEYRHKLGPIAILRLDGDWYESTKIPLENFYDLITPGGAVIIDDYATCFGSRKAVDEFRLKKNIKSPLIPDGRGGAWFEKPME